MIDVGITLSGTDLVARARVVEALGFESVWLPDLQFGDGRPALDAVTALGVLAGATERVRLGFGTLVLPTRQVAWLASQLVTLQQLSGDRVLLGVGAGGFPGAPFWQAVGSPARGRGRRMDDALLALPALLAGRRVELNGATVSFAPATMPPVLVGGNSDAALDRAIRFGDEWFPSLISPAQLGERVRELRKRAAGRRTPGITVGGHAFVSSSPDSFVRSLIDDHGMSEVDAREIPMPGTAAHFAAYEAAGAHRVVLSVDAPDEKTWRRDLEIIAAVTGRASGPRFPAYRAGPTDSGAGA